MWVGFAFCWPFFSISSQGQKSVKVCVCIIISLYGWGYFCVHWHGILVLWVFFFMLNWMFLHDYLDTYCFECLICMHFVFLSMFHMERRSRNTLITIITIIIIIIIKVVQKGSCQQCLLARQMWKNLVSLCIMSNIKVFATQDGQPDGHSVGSLTHHQSVCPAGPMTMTHFIDHNATHMVQN